jgi:hypothetical protein
MESCGKAIQPASYLSKPALRQRGRKTRTRRGGQAVDTKEYEIL